MAKTHLSDLELEQPGIEAGEINSQLAPAGQVLTSDGSGGAGWSTPQAKIESAALVIGDPAGGSPGANAIDMGRNRTTAKRAGGESSIVIGQGAAYAHPDSAKAVVVGYGAQAKGGTHAVVIGAQAVTVGRQVVLIGGAATGHSDNSVGIGHGCSSGRYGAAMGYLARSGYKGIAIGYRADTDVNQAEGGLAIGAFAAIAAAQGIALGTMTEVAGVAGIAIGYGARISNEGDGSIAIGGSSKAYAEEATLVGYGIAAYSGLAQVTAVGSRITASGKGFTGLGSQAQGGAYAVALGFHAQANASGAIAVGKSAVANVASALAIGPAVSNAQANSLKIGWNNTTGFAHFTTFTPTTGAPAATHFLPVNLGGTTFKVLLAS